MRIPATKSSSRWPEKRAGPRSSLRRRRPLGAETGIYSAERLEKLADSLDAIGRELSEQYNIGYTPSNAALDGTYRNIKVVALRKGVLLRSKPGYFASPNVVANSAPAKGSGAP